MLDGTGWAAAEIVVFMLIATIIGLVIGWVLGRWVLRSNIGGEYEAELEAAWDQVSAAETRLADLQAELDESQLEATTDQARVADVEAAKAELADKDAEVARLTAGLDASRLERAALEEELDRVRADLAASAARVEALAADLTTTTADAPAAAVVEDPLGEEAAPRMARTAEPAGAVIGEAGPTRQQGLERMAEIAERTAGFGPREDDDLRKVHGIGPKLERTLKDLGMTSFRQIANLRQDEIACVTAALGVFKGRIERDDWVGSAAKEHEKRYGEPV